MTSAPTRMNAFPHLSTELWGFVVQVGHQKQIIVKVPTEPTSRYVKIGQRLANGKVLVKRVDFKTGADPVVVFEQSGVEIQKEVGSKPATEE